MCCTQTTSEGEQRCWKERLQAYAFFTTVVNVQKTDETASAQELNKHLRRIFTVNLRSAFSEIDAFLLLA